MDACTRHGCIQRCRQVTAARSYLKNLLYPNSELLRPRYGVVPLLQLVYALLKLPRNFILRIGSVSSGNFGPGCEVYS